MGESLDRESLDVWRAFLAAHSKIVDRLAEELETEAGLPLTWYEVLLALSEADRSRLRMHQLAESMLLSRSAATRFIDRMEGAGLVERIQCLTDGRGTFVQLSSRGRQRLNAARPIHSRVIEAHFGSQVSSTELATIERVMTRLAESEQTNQEVAANR